MTMAEHRSRLRILDELDAPMLWTEIEARQRRAATVLARPTPWRHRAPTIVVAVAVAVAGTLFAVRALAPTGRVASLDTSTWSTREIVEMRLAFSYPSEWHLQPVDERLGRAEMIGSVVSNIDHRFLHPDLGPNSSTSAWDLRGLPDDAVVLSIEHVEAIGLPPRGDTDRPLDLDRAQRSVGQYVDPGWVGRWLPFGLAGMHDSVFFLFGPEATEHDREVARRIVASIRPIPG
jgi:hypothetical protein